MSDSADDISPIRGMAQRIVEHITQHLHHPVWIGVNDGCVRLYGDLQADVLLLRANGLRGHRDRLDQSPACLNVLDFKDPVRVRLTLFNDISHYADHPERPHAKLSKWWDMPEKTA